MEINWKYILYVFVYFQDELLLYTLCYSSIDASSSKSNDRDRHGALYPINTFIEWHNLLAQPALRVWLHQSLDGIEL